MNSKEYWRKREDEALEKYKKSEAEYDKEIYRIYSDMLDACNKEINAFYGKYATAEEITLAEAKKRVSELDIKEYERKAARYVKDASLDRKAGKGKTNKQGYYFSEKANEEMRLYNLTMKVNRLEMLKANIGLEMIKGHAELETFMSGILRGRTEEELARQAGILGKTVRNNAKLAHAIPNASFHNATFSDRVWAYHDIMKADLEKLLTRGLIQGKNPRQLARELEKYVMGDAKGGARFNAERLMRTELARVQTEAQKQSFERNGFKEYEFIANSDCCDICKDIDGKHFKVSKMMPGENAAPMHPHCRCSAAAYSDRKEYDEWLDFLEKGGSTAEYEKLKAKGAKIPTAPKKAEKQAEKQPETQTTADDFTPASNMTEAKQRFSNALGIPEGKINFGRMKPELANMYLEGVERFMADFPMLKGFYGTLGTKATGNTLGLNKLTGTYEYIDGVRYIRYSSELHFRNPQDISKMMKLYADVSKNGEGYANCTPLSTAVHELVHGIDKAITLKKQGAFDESGLNGLVYSANHGLATSGVSRKIIKQVREEMFGTQYGKEVAEATRYLGKYARTSPTEELAEAISYEYVNPSNPYSARILELFKKEVEGAFGQ